MVSGSQPCWPKISFSEEKSSKLGCLKAQKPEGNETNLRIGGSLTHGC